MTVGRLALLVCLGASLGCAGASRREDPPEFRPDDPRVEISDALQGVIQVANVDLVQNEKGQIEAHAVVANFSDQPRLVLLKTYFRDGNGDFLDDDPEASVFVVIQGKPRDYAMAAFLPDAEDFLIRIGEAPRPGS